MFTRLFSAASLGCLGHFVAFAIAGGGVGMFAFITIPTILGFFTIGTLVLCFLIGLILRSPRIRSAWYGNIKLAGACLLIGIALFLLGLFTAQPARPLLPDEDPDGRPGADLGVTTYPGLTLAVFAVAFWPRRFIPSWESRAT